MRLKVAINYDRVADDSKWDGLKGYLTNTDIPTDNKTYQTISEQGGLYTNHADGKTSENS